MKKVASLKLGLALIAFFCWVIPVLLLVVLVAQDSSRAVKQQYVDVIDNSVGDIAQAVSTNVAAIVQASRNASYDGTIRNAYEQYLIDGDTSVLFAEVNDFLNKNYRYNENVMAAFVHYIALPNEVFYTFNPMYSYSNSSVRQYKEDLYGQVVEAAENLGTGIAVINHEGSLYFVRNIVDSDFQPLATLTLKANTQKLFSLFESTALCTGAAVYLNGTEHVIFKTDDTRTSFSLPDKYAIKLGDHIEYETDSMIQVSGRENASGVDVLYQMEFKKRDFTNSFMEYSPIINAVTLMFIPIFVFGVNYFMRNIFRPMSDLTFMSRKIEKGELGAQITDDQPNREFQYLVDTFNHMSVRLKSQFDRIYNEELALRDAKIMALQMQINPHFLNNTLEIINWEARLGNNEKVSRMIEALSTILDAAMSRDRSHFVPLSKELMYLESYLYIISERFGKRITIIKDLDRSLLQYRVPRLIMQPIIENAIEHGVSIKQHGTLILTVCKSDDKILLCVENDSPLLEEDKRKIKKLLSPDFSPKDEGSGNLGIHNVNMRLHIIYGDEGGLEIIGDDYKTLSIITIPIQEMD